jgi:hypothetical protein
VLLHHPDQVLSSEASWHLDHQKQFTKNQVTHFAVAIDVANAQPSSSDLLLTHLCHYCLACLSIDTTVDLEAFLTGYSEQLDLLRPHSSITTEKMMVVHPLRQVQTYQSWVYFRQIDAPIYRSTNWIGFVLVPSFGHPSYSGCLMVVMRLAKFE